MSGGVKPGVRMNRFLTLTVVVTGLSLSAVSCAADDVDSVGLTPPEVIRVEGTGGDATTTSEESAVAGTAEFALSISEDSATDGDMASDYMVPWTVVTDFVVGDLPALPTGSTSCRPCFPRCSTCSWPRWCPSSRNAGCSGLPIKAGLCAIISGCRDLRLRHPEAAQRGETTMFSHVTIGSNDVGKAKPFYDALLEPLRGKGGGDRIPLEVEIPWPDLDQPRQLLRAIERTARA